MFSPTDIVNGLSTEIAGAILLALVAAAWGLRKPETRQSLRTEVIRRLTALLTGIRENVFRKEVLPYAVTLSIAIALEDTRWATASQAIFGVVVLAYACAAIRYIVKRPK